VLCTQSCTQASVDISEVRSFAECGGTSVNALLMSEDLKQVFSNIHSHHYHGDHDDRLPLLLDKILHCSLSDVVQYITSQLTTSSAGHSAAAAADDDDDMSVPAVKRLRTDALYDSTTTDVSILVENELGTLVSCSAGAITEAASSQTAERSAAAACSCGATSSTSRRACAHVYCQHCFTSVYRPMTIDDLSECFLFTTLLLNCVSCPKPCPSYNEK